MYSGGVINMVVLFNSKLWLFLGQLRSKWSGLVKVIKVFPYGAVEVCNESTNTFTVNEQHLKSYFVEKPINKAIIIPLPIPIIHRGEGFALHLERVLVRRQLKSS